MAARLLLFATPIAVLVAVMQVPANSAVPTHTEVRLAPVQITAVSETGDYVGTTVQLVEHTAPAEANQHLRPTRSHVEPTFPVAIDQPLVAPQAVDDPHGKSPAHRDIARLRVLSESYWRDPDSRSAIATELFSLSQRIYFSKSDHYVAPHVVRPGEILSEIAAKYQVPWEYLAKLNSVTPAQLRAGSSIKVTPGPFNVIVERTSHLLTVHAHGYVVAAFDVGLGRPIHDGNTSTPTGTFTIAERLTNPTWYGPHGVVSGNDPSNPLGEYWLGLSDPEGNPTTLGIHGTLAPHTVGQNSSNGCIRLRTDDISQLFRLLTVGSIVEIRD